MNGRLLGAVPAGTGFGGSQPRMRGDSGVSSNFKMSRRPVVSILIGHRAVRGVDPQLVHFQFEDTPGDAECVGRPRLIPEVILERFLKDLRLEAHHGFLEAMLALPPLFSQRFGLPSATDRNG